MPDGRPSLSPPRRPPGRVSANVNITAKEPPLAQSTGHQHFTQSLSRLCETGHTNMQNDPFRTAEKAVSSATTALPAQSSPLCKQKPRPAPPAAQPAASGPASTKMMKIIGMQGAKFRNFTYICINNGQPARPQPLCRRTHRPPQSHFTTQR